MNFPPLTETEIQTAMLLADGVYDYQVIKSEDKVSQAGNEYISLILGVFDCNGKEHPIYTNLCLAKLIKHFCDVNGMGDVYQSGSVSSNQCMSKSGGKVVIGFKAEKPNPKGGMYKAKNVVLDYVVAPECSITRPIQPNVAPEFINDDVPF